MPDVWVKVLELLDRLMNAGTETDALAEAVREGVKNVLLVMDDTGYLERDGNSAGVAPPHVTVPKATSAGGADGAGDEQEDDEDGAGDKEEKEKEKQPAKIEVWTETNRRLDRFLPGLMEELFPAPAPPPPVPQQQQGAEVETGAGNAAVSN